MRTRHHAFSGLSVLLLLTLMFATAAIISAQNSEDDVCAQLVRDALETANESCSALEGDVACYGYDVVDVEAISNAEITFASPGDVVNLADITSIKTARANPNQGEWGIAILNLEDDEFATVSTASRIVMIGDVTLTPTVPPENVEVDRNLGNRFTLEMGDRQSRCLATQNRLLIQTHIEQGAELALNGADFAIKPDSVIVAHALKDGEMTVLVVKGAVEIVVDGRSVTISAGEQTVLTLGGDDGLTVVGVPGEPETFDVSVIQFLPFQLTFEVTEIPALDRWTGTGVELEAGQSYIIMAGELVKTIDYMPWSAPEGHSTADCAAAGRGDWDCRCRTSDEWGTCTLDEVESMRLVGRVGEDGETFIVGAGGFFATKTDGELFLGPNDNTFTDNVGAYYAIIAVASDEDEGSAP